MGGIKLGGTGNQSPILKKAAATYTTGGLSEVDRATGGNVGNALEQVDPTKDLRNLGKTNVRQAGAPNPDSLRMIDASKYAMPAGLSAPMIDQSAGSINMAPQDQFRVQQLQLANQLSNQAQGIGPSVAQNQLREGQSANLAATMAQLASARGAANPGLARQALQTSANIQNQTNQQAATARLQEQMQAAGLLGNVASGARGQDIGLAQQQAANNLSIAGQNAASQSNFQGLQQKYLAMGMSADQANQAAALDFERLNSGVAGQNAAAQNANTLQRNQILGGLLNSAGAAAMTPVKPTP